jgi:DNA invertase Pin-like site-specific DNA recombinase
MADAHRRRFDCVVVWNFDRFARSVSHLLRARNLQGAGHRVCSFSEQMDTSTPASKMVFTVLGAVAELEPSLIAERVKAGLRNAKAKGKRLGRPNMVVDVRRVARLRTQGFGWKKISPEIGIGVGTLSRIARDGSKTRENVFETLSPRILSVVCSMERNRSRVNS